MTPVDQAERLRQLTRPDTEVDCDGADVSVEDRRNGGKTLDKSGSSTTQAEDTRTLREKVEKKTAASSRQRDGTSNGKPVARHATYIAVTSGKGGVGKSNIAVNLSIALAARGRQVTLIDADMGTANADVLCGLSSPHNLSHFVLGRRPHIHDVIVEAPGGFTLVPGASGIRQIADLNEMQRTRLIHGLGELEHSSEIVIIDTNAGISQSVTAMANVADIVLLVITPEPTSIADGYGLIKSMYADSARQSTGMPQRIAVLINMARSRTQARSVYDRIATVTRRFLGLQLDFAGYVPFDANVARSVVRRQPFLLAHPKSPASREVTSLSETLLRHTAAHNGRIATSNKQTATSGGYFSRLAQRLRGGS